MFVVKQINWYKFNMAVHNNIGKLGEDIACKYLENKGYKLITRNFSKPWGELDIISESPEGILVFVEVKTMCESDNQGMVPEDNFTAAKLGKFKKVAMFYAEQYPETYDAFKGYRLDLVSITTPGVLRETDLNKLLDICRIEHYENVLDL